MRNYYGDYWTDEVKTKFVQSGKANAFMRMVYVTMSIGLAITGLAAYYFGTNIEQFPFLYTGPWPYIIMFSPLAFVLALSFGINRMSFQTASIVFGVYSFVMGLSLSYIFVIYSDASIAKTFFITAGTFGAMALIGTTTKVDLSKFSSILFMGLIGVIIASVVNMFMQSDTFDFIISLVGVALFCGLTAYDVQRLLQMGAHADTTHESVQKAGLMGALSLYLDFINLFLFLLRFFGSSDD